MNDYSLKIGQNYFFESVTSHYYIGTLVAIEGPHTVILKDVDWISDTGRLNEFMRNGSSAQMEVEPIDIKCVHWASWSPWPHPLIRRVV